MFSGYTSGEYQSVVFFIDGHVDREMMFSEFEAILDNFVPVPGYSNKNIQAVCLGINGQLKIISSVFFLLNFDNAGNADPKWNLPLQQLADQSDLGPDLGAGPIKLCCRSQCPVDWHVQDLWDPDMNRQPNDFVLLRDIVRRNRLGFKELPLDVDDIHEVAANQATNLPPNGSQQVGSLVLPVEGELSDADKALAHSLIQYIRKKIATDNAEQIESLQRQHMLELAAQKNRLEDNLREIEQLHSDDFRQIQAHLQQLQESYDLEKNVSDKLRIQLQEQQQITENLRETFHLQLAETKQVEGNQIELLKSNFESELNLRIESITCEFQEKINSRDIEILYCNEQRNQLREEISKMHQENAKLIKEAGEQFLSRLRENKITFMAYHLGAGNIAIDLDDIGTYLENPVSYVANICKVSEGNYLAWLKHYGNPTCCEFSVSKGEHCGKKLRRVEFPEQFVPGRSDKCPLHWTFSVENSVAKNT